MFNIHEGDEYYLNLDSFDMNDANAHFGQIKTRSDLLNGDDLIKNLSTRTKPHRLPPLIKELVGTIDSDFTGSGVTSNNIIGKGQNNILRKVRRDDDDRLEEMTKRGIKDFSAGEDSIAMVAAAAAAAMWSETGAKRDNLKMKTINNEWKEALRWISSWGQHLQSHDMRNRGTGTKQRRRRDPSDAQRVHSDRLSAENEIDFERFLDVCIDRCIGDDGGDKDHRASTYHKRGADITSEKLEYRRNQGINQFFSSIILLIQKVRLTQGVIQSLTTKQTIRGMLGFIISTAVIWFIRNINDWRKINKYTTSLRSLLEEETREANTSDTGVKHRHTSNKKSGSSKKARRKRRDNRNHQKDREIVIQKSICDNESEASEDSFERRYIEEERHRRNSDDQVSKEGNTTISSCTTEGDGFEFQMMSTDATIMKLNATNKDTETIKNHQTIARKQQRKDPPVSRTERNYDTRKGRNVLTSKQNISKVHFEARASNYAQNGLLDNHISPLVPTVKQREEAEQKLREFQQAQIQKIMNSKQRRQKVYANKGHVFPAANQTTMRDLDRPDMLQSVGKKDKDTTMLKISPPPGLTRVTKGVNIDQKKQEYDPEADVGHLLSHLLDGDDEESNSNSPPKEISPDRYALKRNEKVRSIALGDLLVGTYSGPRSSSNVNSLSSNPWNDESVGGSTVETYMSSPNYLASRNTTTSHSSINKDLKSTDANFCLQVSAVAFSPSMTSNPSNDGRIW